MSGSTDNLLDSLKLLNTQGYNYILAVFDETKNKDTDQVKLFSSYSIDQLKKLNKVLTAIEENIENGKQKLPKKLN